MQDTPSQSAYNYCALPLASYACRPDMSRGRLHEEGESRHRTPYQRDRDRIIHSSAFRRLKYKTQVFVYHEGDHYRTRLTHTLEVAQIARSLARSLFVNEDLAEAVALAHDLGHTPFAHMGEENLKLCMKDLGGFDHNDQSLRVLTVLENRYPGWRGLNLTWETLEGVVKHNGPALEPGRGAETLPFTLRHLWEEIDLELETHASVEAQIAALSDDIAYNNHDVEDGLRAGLFTLAELRELGLTGEAIGAVEARHSGLSHRILVHETIREMIGLMVEDVLEETRNNLKKLDPSSVDAVRKHNKQIVSFSNDMRRNVDELRGFLFRRMYRHYTINRIWLKVENLVGDLFKAFMDNYALLPDPWQTRVVETGGLSDSHALARVVCDYIAGMTDRYAIREHERLFDLYWDLK